MNKRYLGDGVYVFFDGWNFVLSTEDGIRITNTIYIEPEVLSAFNQYVEELRAATGKGR